MKISPDGRLVAYLRARDDDKDRFDLWAFDVRNSRDRLLVDSRTLAGADRALSTEEEARRERQRTSAYSGIVEYSFAPDSRHLLIPLNGDLYVYDLARKPADAVRRLTSTDAYETDSRFSPRSNFVSFVRDQNLYLIDLATGKERAVTRDGGGLVSFGVAEFIAQEEMDRDTGYWWSPDERHIALARVDESPVAEVERFEIQAAGATVVRQRYPATGARNARVDLFVADLAAESRLQLDLGANADVYLPEVEWFPDSRGIAVQRQSRDQKTLELLRFDALSGRGRVLITEHNDFWVPLNHELTFLRRTPQFIWASSRDGFQHLYLYGNDGQLIRQITTGEFMVEGESPEAAVRAVDERADRVYFTANLPSPVERQMYWVSLNSPGAPQRVTTGAGWHSIAMSKDARVFVDVFSNVDSPRNVSLRTAGGKLLSSMLPNRLDATHPYAPFVDEHVRAELGTITAADGQTMQYRLLKPRNLTPGKRYPVHRRRVRRSRRAARHQHLGKPVPSVPGATRLRGVPARQPRQRHAWRAFRDGSRPSHGQCRSAGPGARRGIPARPAIRRRQAHRHLRLELRRIHGAHVPDAGAGCIRGRGRRRAGHRLGAVRHPLHRALPIYSAVEPGRIPAQQRARARATT